MLALADGHGNSGRCPRSEEPERPKGDRYATTLGTYDWTLEALRVTFTILQTRIPALN
jgi:hypothetical protein